LLSGCGKDFSFYNSDFYSVSDLLQQVRPWQAVCGKDFIFQQSVSNLNRTCWEWLTTGLGANQTCWWPMSLNKTSGKNTVSLLLWHLWKGSNCI
jgi:hypothetical protein